MEGGQLIGGDGGVLVLVDGKVFPIKEGTVVLVDKASLIKIYADMVNDLLLVASMYHSDYPFDEDHKMKQDRLFKRAQHLLGNTMEILGKSVDWLAPTDMIVADYEAFG